MRACRHRKPLLDVLVDAVDFIDEIIVEGVNK